LQDKAGELIDQLVGICFSLPEYLREVDCCRYIVLLNELKNYKYKRLWRPEVPEIAVKQLEISELGQALEAWVGSFFNDPHPLMPCYALDTVRFIQFHIDGFHSFEAEHWELKPLFEESREERDIFRFFDASFKKDFTSRMGGLVVRCKVPSGACIKYNDMVVVPENTEFCFVIRRCHLSSGFQDYELLFCEEPHSIPFDLMKEFRFMGEILMAGEGTFASWTSDPNSFSERLILFPETYPQVDFPATIPMELPAHWITHALKFDSDFRNPPVLDRVPVWYAEIPSKNNL
jgi:hypothetical protein